MPTTPTSPNDPPLRPLSADAFIRAMKGETVVDENGNGICFFKDEIGVIIHDVIVNEYVEVRGGTFLHSCTIVNCNFVEHFIINGGGFMNGLSLESEFQKGLAIKGGSFKQSVVIDGGFFLKATSIQDGEFLQGFFIYGGQFTGGFCIRGGVFHVGIGINGGVFEKWFDVEGGIVNGFLDFNGGEFKDEVDIKGGEVESVMFTEGKLKRVNIWQPPRENSKRGRIRILTLLYPVDFELNVKLYQICFFSLYKEILSNGKISISNLSLQRIYLYSVFNNGKLRITNLTTYGDDETRLSILNCDLGQATFFNTDFTSFDKIIIQNSRISDIITNNIHLPISLEKAIYTSEELDQNPNYLEEIYNQLYLAMQKQGNRTQEVKYYSEYLECHRKARLNELKRWRLEGKSWRWRVSNADWYTPAALWLHKVSSGYGNNWVRSTVITVLGTALLYYCYALSLPEWEFGFEGCHGMILGVISNITHSFYFLLIVLI